MNQEKLQQAFEVELNQMIEKHRTDLLQLARRFVPNATSDDILQPNDFPELEGNPYFRYEEGILAGLLSAQAVFNAICRRE